MKQIVLATDKLPSLSERYKFIPTDELIAALTEYGFTLTSFTQMNKRNAALKPYAKHMFRMKRRGSYEINEVYPEIVGENSYDGTTRFYLMFGLFRKACSNGLVISDATIASISLVHCGYTLGDQIEEGMKTIDSGLMTAVQRAKDMGDVAMNSDDRLLFASKARPEGSKYEPEILLTPRRYGDKDAIENLWGTLNVVQENLIRGGNDFTYRQGDHTRRNKTREIKCVDRLISENKHLWDVAEEFMT